MAVNKQNNVQTRNGKRLRKLRKNILNKATKQRINYLLTNSKTYTPLINQAYNTIFESDSFRSKIIALDILRRINTLQGYSHQLTLDICTVLKNILGQIQLEQHALKTIKHVNNNKLIRHNRVMNDDLNIIKLLMMTNQIFHPLIKRIDNLQVEVQNTRKTRHELARININNLNILNDSINNIIKTIKSI